MLTLQDIKYIIENGITHLNYNKTVALAEDLHIHANGEYPLHLIDERRPNEPEITNEYREKIYQPITKKEINKVFTSLEKIRRSPDWQIKFKTNEFPPIIPEDENPEYYTTIDYPNYTSLTNWAFEEYVANTIDANAIVAVIPETDTVPRPETEDLSNFIRPVAKIFESKNVLWHTPNEDVLLLSNEKIDLPPQQLFEKGVLDASNIYYYLDTTRVIRILSNNGSINVDYDYLHNIGELPAFKVGGRYLISQNNDIIFDSLLSPMTPSLNEAVREFSDLQASIVQHLYPEKYIFMDMTCEKCSGNGMVLGEDKPKECDKCKGTGKIPATDVSPYGIHIIELRKEIDKFNVPTPPIDYIRKDTSIIALQDERIKNHLRDALAAVNMEFLAQVPLNQSGRAKEVDRDELNAFVNTYAELIVKTLDNVHYFINEYRYRILVPNEEIREKLIPFIPVPQRYDFLSLTDLMNDLEAAKKANVSSFIIRQLEDDYIRKKFNAEPELTEILQVKTKLDPLLGYSVSEKESMLNSGGITKLNYVISCNIETFIDRAEFEYSDFYDLDFVRQKEILNGYAMVVIAENRPANDINDNVLRMTLENE